MKIILPPLSEDGDQLIKKLTGEIPSVAGTANYNVRIIESAPDLAQRKVNSLAGSSKKGRKHALGATIDVLKQRFGAMTLEDLLAILENADLIDDLHLAESNPIPTRTFEVERDDEVVTYSVIQKRKRNIANANYKTKTVSFSQLKSYL